MAASGASRAMRALTPAHPDLAGVTFRLTDLG
jgi:hypothetical protein